MSPRQLHKQLLIAESEMNRIQMSRDAAALDADIRALSARARAISSIASSFKTLASELAGSGEDSGPRKTSRLQVILKSAGLISTLWRTFHWRNQS